MGNASKKPWKDYSHEVKTFNHPALRWTYIALGWLFVISGMIGVVLPGWPTTIFMILATYFFARSSPRFYNYIMNHAIFGPGIRDWRSGRGMSMRAKIMAIGTILVTIPISIWVIPVTAVKVLLGFIMLTLVSYLGSLPTKRSEEAPAPLANLERATQQRPS
jgi:uncharacterized membrane protein YbaN (DUF454 family)